MARIPPSLLAVVSLVTNTPPTRTPSAVELRKSSGVSGRVVRRAKEPHGSCPAPLHIHNYYLVSFILYLGLDPLQDTTQSKSADVSGCHMAIPESKLSSPCPSPARRNCPSSGHSSRTRTHLFVDAVPPDVLDVDEGAVPGGERTEHKLLGGGLDVDTRGEYEHVHLGDGAHVPQCHAERLQAGGRAETWTDRTAVRGDRQQGGEAMDDTENAHNT